MVNEASPETDAVSTAVMKEKRERSRIEFPYTDLDSAIAFCEAIIRQGGGTASEEQVAAWLNQTVSGGTFRTRLSATRMFGLVEGANSGLRVTTLGRRITDPPEKPQALIEAFLRIPLYKHVYGNLKGYALPPAAAIERQMVAAGVVETQKDRARQAFVKSAAIAGFIDAHSGRFVQPGVVQQPPPRDEPQEETPVDTKVKDGSGNGGGGGSSSGNLHPFITGLLQTLPEPGGPWNGADRVKWLQTAASIFGLIYKGGGEVEVKLQTAPNGDGANTE